MVGGGGLTIVRRQLCSWKVLLNSTLVFGVQVHSLRTPNGSSFGGNIAEGSLP